jgi:hypothetical protein
LSSGRNSHLPLGLVEGAVRAPLQNPRPHYCVPQRNPRSLSPTGPAISRPSPQLYKGSACSRALYYFKSTAEKISSGALTAPLEPLVSLKSPSRTTTNHQLCNTSMRN